jgi:hypothetical protein
MEVMEFYVTPSWVAQFYGASHLQVYRAIKAGKLKAYRVRTSTPKGKSWGTLVLDSRELPAKFPG